MTTEEQLAVLTGRLDMLTQQVAKVDVQVEHLTLQVERFVEASLRGFTATAQRHGELERRLDEGLTKLETVIARLGTE
jgi:hypothetical protein